MHRHEWLPAGIVGMAIVGLLLAATPGNGQDTTGRATVQPSTPRERTQQPRQQQPQAQVQRPAGGQGFQLPGELEQLLIAWEQKSSQITRLRGMFMRYVYDNVFSVEKVSRGMFWYYSPDKGRMDFRAIELPDPPIDSRKVDANGEPFHLEADENQRWICTGKEIYIIHDDVKLYDYIEIPPQQQGQNISRGPLPFLFGIQAEEAKNRYQLSLGDQNWPRGRVIERDGEQVQLTPQVHVIAYPKLELDAREWRRAEVLLDGVTFLPRAIRLLDPTMNRENVYVFDLPQMKVNEPIWINNPFNDKPPGDYTKHWDSRAQGDEMQQMNQGNQGIVPMSGEAQLGRQAVRPAAGARSDPR
jgi:TIGR03009 family protein